MEELGLNPRRFHFAAGFGRELEYYTGFTFQIEADTPHGPVAVAGGGRYDNLLSDMGSPVARSRGGLRHPHRPAEGGAGMSTLTLAIPSKGRLMEATAGLLAKAGLTIDRLGADRGYRGLLDGHGRGGGRLPLGLRNRPEPA